MYAQKIRQIRDALNAAGASGALLSTQDNIFYASGFSSVMDGWHLIEPIAAVLVPADAALPVLLILPEASIISLIVSARAGHPVYYEGIATFDMLNFCETARAEDAHLALPDDLLSELGQVLERVEGHCEPDIIKSIAATLSRHLKKDDRVLFDDLRVAARVEALSGQRTGDALEVMLSSRVIKTPEELDMLRESGVIADEIMAYTISQLSIGTTWAEVEKSVAHFMINHDVDPLPGSPMLFGGAYDLVFRPDLFRTPVSRPFQGGEIAILETQGRYKNFWIDINRTAHIGPASQAYRDQYAAVRDTFDAISARLKPGANTAEICQFSDIVAAQRLDPPEKLLVVAHSVGLVPLESPVKYPGTGLHGAKEGFVVQPGMVISIDCLYFGSGLGPSHMENVFIVGETGAEPLYQSTLDLMEVG
ncbi:M24 family metallopeptidase [Luminiphilus sp.]|jgi:Xaa-Pro dipeptidase|nr:M24 family metallopeptidase [Luminiphilus sp.]